MIYRRIANFNPGQWTLVEVIGDKVTVLEAQSSDSAWYIGNIGKTHQLQQTSIFNDADSWKIDEVSWVVHLMNKYNEAI